MDGKKPGPESWVPKPVMIIYAVLASIVVIGIDFMVFVGVTTVGGFMGSLSLKAFALSGAILLSFMTLWGWTVALSAKSS